MTTPTLVDAARSLMNTAYAARVAIPSGQPDGAELVRRADIVRAAIDREAERQEIIEGLVKAARVYAPTCSECPSMATNYLYAGGDEHYRCDIHRAQRGRVFDLDDASEINLRAALARYDAMKEDDRAVQS